MSEIDSTHEFVDSLPRIEADESFCFSCHPGVPCFNRCCADLNLVLSPYDVLRLRQALHMPSRDFLDRHTTVIESDGFPLVQLRMLDDERQLCPFVTSSGCSVYADRPGACRSYPIGRGISMHSGKIEQQLVIVREDHCEGFTNEKRWTPESWYADQQIEEYNRFSDRLVMLLSRCQRLSFERALGALYCVDEREPEDERRALWNVGPIDIEERHK